MSLSENMHQLACIFRGGKYLYLIIFGNMGLNTKGGYIAYLLVSLITKKCVCGMGGYL